MGADGYLGDVVVSARSIQENLWIAPFSDSPHCHAGSMATEAVTCYDTNMITSLTPSITPFTRSERECIRRELGQFFGTLPTVAEGFQLRTWRGGLQKRQAKLPPTLRT
jgi:hypothetical protein